MRSTLAAAIGATALLGATAPLPALGQHIATGPRVMGIVTPAQHIVPKDGAYVLVLMEVAGPRDKILCSRFVQRYGAAQAYDAGSGAYGLYWIVGAPRALTSDDCASAPVTGLADGLYDYQRAPDLIRHLYLPRTGGPFFVVVKCDPDGANRVNAGYIDLGRVQPDQLARKFADFERYLDNPEGWSKKRRIDRDPIKFVTDTLQTPVRIAGRATGAIKRMEACRA